MIRTQVYIPDDLYKEAKLATQLYGVTFSEMIRTGLSASVKTMRQKNKKKMRQKDPWKNIIGFIKGIKTDAVKDIHDYYKHGVVK